MLQPSEARSNLILGDQECESAEETRATAGEFQEGYAFPVSCSTRSTQISLISEGDVARSPYERNCPGAELEQSGLGPIAEEPSLFRDEDHVGNALDLMGKNVLEP